PPPARRPRILLRNGWQSVNIGDIAHPLGFLELLERHGIDADVALWPTDIGNGARELLARSFPRLEVLDNEEAIQAALRRSDFFVHGSAGGLGWREETGRPFGVMGISFVDEPAENVQLLSAADFVFFRDGVSLAAARSRGCTSPVVEFGPDAVFACTRPRDDAAAEAFLRRHGLEPGRFLCCIPRYRWTPYWSIHAGTPVKPERQARNDTLEEQDHAWLRGAIETVVRSTHMSVLVCPEDMSQVALGKRLVYDRLPEDVRARVVWRDRFWLTDEALSTFVRSAGLFGFEMHSPILCIANGVPAVVCRSAEQTSKGFMWRDIGLEDWLFDLDDPRRMAALAETVVAIARDPEAASRTVAAARDVVRARQRREAEVLRASLAAAVRPR
ncbi:MAG: polysaccharide pyruvyl transferase family protein, partial [Planctomycetia bacterium]|nr:polysaccharide pyruvyl transferase family protein [Planctomycetia bacterium]